MSISIFDLFSIGVGPSSSHTVGPMRAAHNFITLLQQQQLISLSDKITVELFGSLAHTGLGHGTDKAVLMGLAGHLPHTIDPDTILPSFEAVRITKKLVLPTNKIIEFDIAQHLIFNFRELLPLHSNGMRFTAYQQQNKLFEKEYYSIGGGFIICGELSAANSDDDNLPYPFQSAKELLDICQKNHLKIHEVMWANELTHNSAPEIRRNILNIANIMRECIKKGYNTEGLLPGSLQVKRRAHDLFKKLSAKGIPTSHEYSDSMSWLNVFAIAVNEENAAGGRVVTAPTNGAAGIIPAVLEYYRQFYREANDDKIIEFLLTAAAIAVLYKKGASISAAEVGCQGEVGVACSMAAGALTAVLGGTLAQIENAAEIAMEHHLGLTCDPIAGLVQIPCIERNAIGAVKAVNIAKLALMESGEHKVSLDKVIATMLSTGRDMQSSYKETSLAGLANSVNLPEC